MGGINNRTLLIAASIVGIALVFIVKLFILQVYDPSYKLSADSNTRRTVTQYPSRGLVYDRNGKLLVSNQAVYDVMVVPRDIVAFDTIDFCKSIDYSIEQLRARFVQMRKDIEKGDISTYKASVFMKQLSVEQYGNFQEKLHKFKGFFVQVRTLRKYEYPSAAHVLGYVSEISNEELKKDQENEKYYTRGDYLGVSGIEKTYEHVLRGKKGVKYKLVDVHGREKGEFNKGKQNRAAIAGKNITLSLDVDLQQYGEKLMQNKIGSIVAIEPSSGEILAFVSAPGYDPSILVGRNRGAGFSSLKTDSLKPFNNRALQGTYSPGSTFKLINAAIALQEDAITELTCFVCRGPVSSPIRCTHHHRSPIEVAGAIETSCNPFFYHTFKQTLERPGTATRDGYVRWYDHVKSFGFGSKLEIDLPYEKSGNVPKIAYYDRYYGKHGWKAITVRSLAIGQGELSVTPLQMANQAAIIANRGKYFHPHVVKTVENKLLTDKYYRPVITSVEAENFDEVIKGMQQVYTGSIGTARYYQNKDISMCGKTGTVENPFGEDHAVFIAFAPKENPQIAICVIVENAGYGSTWAAPMATLVMEKYLSGTIPHYHKYYEKKMLEGDFIHAK